SARPRVVKGDHGVELTKRDPILPLIDAQPADPRWGGREAAGLGDQYERLTVRRPRAAAELLVGQREPADRVGARRPLGDGELHWLVVVGPLPGLVQDQQIIEMPQRQTNLGALSQPQLDARSIDL